MVKQSTSFLRQHLPKAKQLNKPVIWVAGGIIGAVLLIVAALSLQGPNLTKKKVDAGQARIAQDSEQSVDNLPENYSDTQKIRGYLEDDDSKLKNELASFRQQTQELQQQINQLKQQPTQPVTQAPAAPSANLNQRDQQAARSTLFFPGGAPITPKTGQQPVGATQSQAAAAALAAAHRGGGYTAQNMNMQKMDFVKSAQSKSSDQIYNKHAVEYPVSPYEIQAGSFLPAVLITSINTDVPGEAVAEIRRNIYDSIRGRYLLIPSGSKLVGQYDASPSYGQSRVLIVFNRVIRPDGSSILLSSSTSDLFGAGGMEGNVNSHWGRIMGAAVLSTMLSVGTGMVADNHASNTINRGAIQGGLAGAAGNISNIGNQIVGKQLNVQPTLTIPAGSEFNITVNKDIILPPYEGLRE